MTTLEKIKTEIEQIKPYDLPCDKRTPEHIRDMALDIIDKYAEQEPCDDAISREAVYEILDGNWNTDFLCAEVEKLPSVYPKPKTGIWTFAYRFHRKCSVCGEVVNISEDDNYCHKCGAKMEREPNDHLSQF